MIDDEPGPRARSRMVAAAGLAVAVALAACGDDSGDSGPPGRGSAACQDWQDAVCDFASDMCGAISRAACDDQYRGFECRSDDQASECANRFNEAPCTAPPVDCDWSAVADPQPAVGKCSTILETACRLEMRCGGTRPTADCMAAIAQQLGIDCEGVIGVKLGYDGCLEAIEQAIEQANCSGNMITACTGVLLFPP